MLGAADESSSAVHRGVSLHVAFGSLPPLALAAQFLHAGAYGREIVSSSGSVHVRSCEHRRKALTPDEAPIMIRTANAAWMRAFA